ncbi:MAG: hypothetical protein ACYC9K_08565 [Sulfuricaulis sp.]
MDELTQIQLVYSLQDVSYVNGLSAGLYDYSSRELSTTLTRQMNPEDQVFFTAGYSIFNVPVTTLTSKSAVYQMGITRTFSETTRGTLSAGQRKTSSQEEVLQITGIQLCPPPNFICPVYTQSTLFGKQSSTVFNGVFEKKLERNSYSITLSRSLNPSGSGGQIQSDFVGLAMKHDFSSRLSGSLNFSKYTNSASASSVSSSGDSRIYFINPSLEWQWTRNWLVDASYSYTHLRRVSDPDPVASNSVDLTLRYQWSKMSISR